MMLKFCINIRIIYLFFIAPENYDEKAVKKFWKNDNPKYVAKIGELLAQTDDFSATVTEPIIHEWITENELPMGQVMNSFRLAIVGASMGPSMFDIIEIIGKEETLKRIANASEKLG